MVEIDLCKIEHLLQDDTGELFLNIDNGTEQTRAIGDGRKLSITNTYGRITFVNADDKAFVFIHKYRLYREIKEKTIDYLYNRVAGNPYYIEELIGEIDLERKSDSELLDDFIQTLASRNRTQAYRTVSRKFSTLLSLYEEGYRGQVNSSFLFKPDGNKKEVGVFATKFLMYYEETKSND